MNTYRLFILPAFFVLINLQSIAQNGYSISSIPDSLKENANVVYLQHDGDFEILSDNRAVFKVKEVIAILNSKGKRYATEVVGYDKLTKIKNFNAVAYNAFGKEIEKLGIKKMSDQSSISGFSIYEDNRIKIADLEQNSYPYIVEFEYEVEYKFLYYIPNWYPVYGENVSVLHSHYQISSPIWLEPKLKLINSDQELVRKKIEDKVEYSIEFIGIKPFEREPYGPFIDELIPELIVSAGKFNFEGYEGDMSSWKKFGKWQLELNKGRTEIPIETANRIRKLTSHLTSKEEKIRAIYQYVQNKTRYVSIQLGIGGFQPFPAETVDELGYGDCKGLSNYTQSLLKVANIDSHYTWVYGGSNPPKINTDFPDDVFNHIILCVPNEQDSIWLECTSQTKPFGYLGGFTGDRDVMLVTPDGGKIVHTPIYNKEVNTQTSKAEVNIKADGSASSVVNVTYSGLQYENNGLDFVIHESHEEQKKWMYENTQISDFVIQDFELINVPERIPRVQQKITLDIPRLASVNGNRIFLTPNLLNRWESIPPRVLNRETDLILKNTFINRDTITYNIPEQLHLEFVPEAIEFSSKFGKYKVDFIHEENKLIYVRTLEIEKGRFPKEDYSFYRDFRKKIRAADKQKVLLLKST